MGQVLNEFATNEAEHAAGLWLLDPSDTRGIARPATNVLWRRGQLGKAITPDVADAITGAIALARYVGRQLRLKLTIRRVQDTDQPTTYDPTAPDGPTTPEREALA